MIIAVELCIIETATVVAKIQRITISIHYRDVHVTRGGSSGSEEIVVGVVRRSVEDAVI